MSDVASNLKVRLLQIKQRQAEQQQRGALHGKPMDRPPAASEATPALSQKQQEMEKLRKEVEEARKQRITAMLQAAGVHSVDTRALLAPRQRL
jgi:hypothetical protein